MDELRFAIDTILKDVESLQRMLQRKLVYERDLLRLTEFEISKHVQASIDDISERLVKASSMLSERIERWGSKLGEDFSHSGIPEHDGAKSATAWLEAEIARALREVAVYAGLIDRLKSEISMILTNARQVSHSAVKAVLGWIAGFENWIKRISAQLWNLLSGLLTPKEWKLGGKTGTGAFGLAEVSVEITFGKP